jgi:hypothetical protein
MRKVSSKLNSTMEIVERKHGEPIKILFLWVFYDILSDCQKSDEMNYLLNASRLDKKNYFCLKWAFWAARPVMKKIAGCEL